MSQRLEADNWERAQLAMRKLAAAWHAGTIPTELKHWRGMTQIWNAVRHRTMSNSYYHVADSGLPSDTSPEAEQLRTWILSQKTSDEALVETKIADERKLQEMLNELLRSPPEGYFPTPIEVASLMLEHSKIGPGMRVLEPSAGAGALAWAIMGAEPNCWLMCNELRPRLCEILTKRGYRQLSIHGNDFMEIKPGGFDGDNFDRIVMNPPFERAQDCEHVRHAYDHLRPGGRLVSVMSGALRSALLGTVDLTYPGGKRYDFLEWVKDKEHYAVDVPSKSFKQSGTTVDVVIVVINKPDEPAEPHPPMPNVESYTPDPIGKDPLD